MLKDNFGTTITNRNLIRIIEYIHLTARRPSFVRLNTLQKNIIISENFWKVLCILRNVENKYASKMFLDRRDYLIIKVALIREIPGIKSELV